MAPGGKNKSRWKCAGSRGFNSNKGVVMRVRGTLSLEVSIPRGIQEDWMRTHQETLGFPSDVGSR